MRCLYFNSALFGCIEISAPHHQVKLVLAGFEVFVLVVREVYK